MDFGDLPTWITAVATTLALGAAIYAGIRAGKLLKIEIDRDRRRDENELRQQAILVAAWHGVVPVHPDAPDDDAGTYGPVVRNGSALPIYQVNVELLPISRTSGEYTYVYEVLPPGQWFVHAENGGLYTTRSVVVHSRPKHAPQHQVAVSFRDAAGNSWRRDQNGVLRRNGTDTEPPSQPTIKHGERRASMG